MFRTPFVVRSRTFRCRSSVPLLALLLLGVTPSIAAQSLDDVLEALREAQQTIARLEQRVAELEARDELSAEDDLEAQLQALISSEPSAPTPHTIFPSATNPRIGVFIDTVAEAGNAEEKLGEDGDRFSVRETEVDFRLPISTFAEGILVSVFEDAGGGGEFEGLVEEGYADISLGGLLDIDTPARLKAGRFRVTFGHDNKLHTHDLLQVNRPDAVSRQFGGEGLAGDGFELSTPLHYTQDEDGLGSTTMLHMAVVNGDMLAGEESVLGELADGAGIELSSDAPVVVTRLSNYTEITPLSDVEVGISYIRDLAKGAIETDVASEIEPTIWGMDVTVRDRDDESFVGSWLYQASIVQSDYDYGAPATAGFPSGNETTRGWWFTAQRQTSPNTYVGMRYGESDILGTADEIRSVAPYVSWYPDEFFRVRLQGEHLDLNAAGTGDTSANRVFMQLTWNFGAHMPHPYWVNR